MARIGGHPADVARVEARLGSVASPRGDREMFAAMAMQALITREGWRADVVAKQAVSSKTEVHFSATPLIVRPDTGATVLARL
jgi:hypothetical protein